MGDVNISLNQLKDLLNYTGNGLFATRAEKTSGQLQLNADGKLINVNRHWYNRQSVSTDGQRNLQLRRALLETFSANGASDTFIANLRERLGLSADLFSNGRTDAQGDVKSAKPLERREIKQIITAFDQERKALESTFSERDQILHTFEVIDESEVQSLNDEIAGRVVVSGEPCVDTLEQTLTKMKAAGNAFLEDLSQKLMENELLPKTTGGTDLRAIYMSVIEKNLSDVAREVVEGKRSVCSALERLADSIEHVIGSKSILENGRRVEESMLFRKVIYSALDRFAGALGVAGKHPFEAALLENHKAKVMNEFLAKPFPEGKSVAQKMDFLFDFAKRVYATSKKTVFLNNRSRLYRDAGDEGNAIFFQNTLPAIVEKCREQGSAFSAFLNRCIQGEKDFKEILEEQCVKNIEALEADPVETEAYMDANQNLSEANAALNGKLAEIAKAKAEGADSERIKALDKELIQLEANVNEANDKLAVLSETRNEQAAIQSIFGWFGLQVEEQVAF